VRLELEKQIKECMKRVVADETFMKQEMHGMDTCLRRCKNLAEVLATMKKLAFIQDPSITSAPARRGNPVEMGKEINHRRTSNLVKASTVLSDRNWPKKEEASKEGKYDVLDSILDELSQEEPKGQTPQFPAQTERRGVPEHRAQTNGVVGRMNGDAARAGPK